MVVFTENNARILHVDDISHLEPHPSIHINPNLKAVEGLPPHFWKVVDGKIVSMGGNERLQRLKHIEQYGCKNDHTLPTKPKKHFLFTPYVVPFGALLFGCALGYLLRG